MLAHGFTHALLEGLTRDGLGPCSRAHRSRCLWKQSILRFEVRTGKSDQLAIAWMVDGLYPNDVCEQAGIVVVNVLHQLGLCVRRTGNKNLARISDGLGDGMKIALIFGRMATPDRICLVMDVSGRMIRMQVQLVHVSQAEMEYPRLMMIDPDDGVIMVLVLAHA